MPEPGCSERWSASQASRCSAVSQPQHAEPQRLAVERAAQHEHAGALVGGRVEPAPELLGDVGGHPRVGGRRRGEHRDALGQVAEQGADPAVVGTEVVAPVGDAVRLVDHQQPRGGGQPGQHLVAEAGVVEPLGAHQQHVDLAGVDRVVDRLPLLDVGGVDRHRADPGPLGRLDLVAHQGEQRRDDHRRARPPASAAAGSPRSRPPTCPTRCAGRRARGAGRPRAPRSPTTGPRGGRRRRGPPAPGGGARPRPARRSSSSCPLSNRRHRRGGGQPYDRLERRAYRGIPKPAGTGRCTSRSSCCLVGNGTGAEVTAAVAVVAGGGPDVGALLVLGVHDDLLGVGPGRPVEDVFDARRHRAAGASSEGRVRGGTRPTRRCPPFGGRSRRRGRRTVTR